jgi:hypothetical protein
MNSYKLRVHARKKRLSDCRGAIVHSWAVFAAIERRPAPASRLHELERLIDAGGADPAGAIAEIRHIRNEAEMTTRISSTMPTIPWETEPSSLTRA